MDIALYSSLAGVVGCICVYAGIRYDSIMLISFGAVTAMLGFSLTISTFIGAVPV